jgi:hypothetical protein
MKDRHQLYREKNQIELRAKARIRSAERRVVSPERARESDKKFREAHREKRRLDQKAYYMANQEQILSELRKTGRQRRLARRGLTEEQYVAMVAAQNGCCAICEIAPPTGKVLYVDHCHVTNRVRGLLCHPCNASLGLMKDEPQRLRRAADYLEK